MRFRNIKGDTELQRINIQYNIKILDSLDTEEKHNKITFYVDCIKYLSKQQLPVKIILYTLFLKENFYCSRRVCIGFYYLTWTERGNKDSFVGIHQKF